jgi:hypothetical protein
LVAQAHEPVVREHEPRNDDGGNQRGDHCCTSLPKISAIQHFAEQLARIEAQRAGELSELDDVDAALATFIFGNEALWFAETIGELLRERPLTVDAARRAALLAAAGQAWENELGPLLTGAQVRALLGDVSRQRVDELLRAHRLIGLRDRAGRRQFPAFQFYDGRPVEPLVAAFWTVADGAMDEWTAASWCVAADEALGGRSPAQWALERRDPDRLARIARQDAARLAQ